jgi:transcriptional regulator with XRE-family HTH domain
MLNMGMRIANARKTKKWAQGDLAKAAKASRDAIGKYERDEVSPSIEVMKNIADSLDVSLDYLVGGNQLSQYDKETLKRINEIEHLPQITKEKLFFIIDSVLRDTKVQEAYK